MEIVRVWCDDKFNGTAFFINSNTLLTAKHVVKGYKKITINEINGGGKLTISQDDIELCNKKDIAIIKIKREFEISNISFFKDIKENMKVKIKGFNDDTSSINQLNYQISGHSNSHHIFKLQNSILNGLSGSPVYYNDKICAITLARDETTTYIIPISEVCIDIYQVENNTNNFTTSTLQYLANRQIVVLLSQDFTDISKPLYTILNWKNLIKMKKSLLNTYLIFAK